MQNVEGVWKDYDQYENDLNKVLVRAGDSLTVALLCYIDHALTPSHLRPSLFSPSTRLATWQRVQATESVSDTTRVSTGTYWQRPRVWRR